MDAREVRCAVCDEVLDEPTDLPQETRKPCPTCGATARKISVTIQALPGVARADGLDAQITIGRATENDVAGSFAVARSDEGHREDTPAHVDRAFETLRSVGRRLEWLEPTDPDEGSYTLMVWDDTGSLIGITEQATWEDAVLALADELGPE